MRHIDLFSGIGGFALAASWTWGKDYQNVGHSEIEEFPCKVYHKHFPESECLGDITKIKWDEGSADFITGGFPCQPFSVAGKRRGKEDDRALWHEMLRAIREVKPRWVIGENVAGIINMELDNVLSELETEGYQTETFVIPACAVNAPHRRDRVWIVAHAESYGSGRESGEVCQENGGSLGGLRERAVDANKYVRYAESAGQQGGSLRSWAVEHGRTGAGSNWYEVATRLCRVDDGVQNRVDRLKSLGNAIVPQVAAEIMKAIKMSEVKP